MGKFTRRDFLKAVCAGTCGSALHNILSPASSMLAYAAPNPISSKVIVILDLQGGCSYTIANPFNSVAYDLWPTTSYKESAAAGSQAITLIPGVQGIHPSLTGFKSVWDEGNLALINLVGYPNPNRSHDESADIWYRAATQSSASVSGGWGARLTQLLGSTYAGFSLSGASLIAEGGSNPPLALDNLSDLGEDKFWGDWHGTDWLRMARSDLILKQNPTTSAQSYIQSNNVNVDSLLLNLAQQTNTSLPVAFPNNNSLADKFEDAAKIIKTLPVNFIYLSIGGFDTHENEKGSLTDRMGQINGAVTAFIANMKALGRWQDVMLITMSEFSRTFENKSFGTDHGHSAPMLVLGGGVKGGIKTPPPTGAEMLAAQSKHGYLYDIHVDFREVFKRAVIAMGLNPDPVFSQPIPNTTYSNLDLFV